MDGSFFLPLFTLASGIPNTIQLDFSPQPGVSHEIYPAVENANHFSRNSRSHISNSRFLSCWLELLINNTNFCEDDKNYTEGYSRIYFVKIVNFFKIIQEFKDILQNASIFARVFQGPCQPC